VRQIGIRRFAAVPFKLVINWRRVVLFAGFVGIAKGVAPSAADASIAERSIDERGTSFASTGGILEIARDPSGALFLRSRYEVFYDFVPSNYGEPLLQLWKAF